jgi:ferric-dicitrate binding protein FerR (iron transport regulator)
MDKIQSLIEKLWKGTISPKEITILEEALKNVNDQETNQVKNHFKKLYEQDTVPHQSNKNAAVLLERILESIDQMEARSVKKITFGSRYIWWAAAVMIGICTIFLFPVNNQRSNTPQNKILHIAQKSKIIENKQQHNINVYLPDGSAIVLFPKSKIDYNNEFNKKDRIINLKGIAIFKVAKDKTRPFSVFSEGFVTTALGTKFLVNSRKVNRVEVRLFEGSVRVRDNDNIGKTLPDIYLKPGQQLTLDKLNTKYEIIAFNANDSTGLSTNKVIAKDKLATKWFLKFNNEALVTTLQKLSKKYKTDIEYNQETVEGLYFTGTVEQTDSLEAVLTIIANMNGLKLKEEEGKLIITK